MPTHAEHAVKNKKFANFFKQVKNTQRVSFKKIVLETCKWVQKQP
jgi:hypothetical protein